MPTKPILRFLSIAYGISALVIFQKLAYLAFWFDADWIWLVAPSVAVLFFSWVSYRSGANIRNLKLYVLSTLVFTYIFSMWSNNIDFTVDIGLWLLVDALIGTIAGIGVFMILEPFFRQSQSQQ